jgi:hypothetical protein
MSLSKWHRCSTFKWALCSMDNKGLNDVERLRRKAIISFSQACLHTENEQGMSECYHFLWQISFIAEIYYVIWKAYRFLKTLTCSCYWQQTCFRRGTISRLLPGGLPGPRGYLAYYKRSWHWWDCNTLHTEYEFVHSGLAVLLAISGVGQNPGPCVEAEGIV